VKLTVSDTGTGISAEIAERVFEPFFTTKEVGRGTGLGLSMVHGAVSRCGGLVTFESQPGRGTSFYVYLPRVEAGQPPAEQPLPPAPRGAERILLVDDEQSVVELSSRILEELGYVITTEISSPAALDRFASKPDSFDLVISDVTMPRMTGGELVAKIKAIRPDIPAILISGFHDEPAPTEEGGAVDIVERVKKPFTRSDLALAIRRALDRRSAHQT
jgi:CheY-like chemotaxis protein